MHYWNTKFNILCHVVILLKQLVITNNWMIIRYNNIRYTNFINSWMFLQHRMSTNNSMH